MNILKNLSIVIASALLGIALYVQVTKHDDSVEPEELASSNAPLYWVAPMDPSFKSDKPGKSPMGMDLIPVFEEVATNQEVGTVSISPTVVNNLGVRTEPVKRGRLDLTVNTVGYVQYDEDRLIHIHPRVEGWIEKLHVKAAGNPVEKGKPLYALYSPTLVNAQEELLLAFKRNNPTLINASVDRLYALQVSKSEIDRLKRTREVRQSITVRAPQAGVLDSLNVREGMFVKPGMEVMTIGQLEHIWVIGEVFERQAADVKEGDPVRMRLDYLPGREWSGTVDYIYPSLDPKTRTAQVRVHFDNPDAYLRPGMFAQMEIATNPTEDILLIPREALIRTGNQARVVLAKGDGRFKSIMVEVGKVSEDQVEVLSGLNEGDLIVTSAQFLIDSESSKTSDFKRMEHEKELPGSIWVEAKVVSSMTEHRMLTATHNAIEEWDWPAMTMDFKVGKTVDMSPLQTGVELHVQITRLNENDYEITETHIKQAKKPEKTATVKIDSQDKLIVEENAQGDQHSHD